MTPVGPTAAGPMTDDVSVAFTTRSPDETLALGRTLGTLLRAGDVLVLTGDLGAGKTQLTKGVAEGMGVGDAVTSSTFTIEMVYEGARMPLYHFDLYRLDDADELEDVGLYDALGSDGPCLVEWGERFADEIGPERVDVILSRLDEEVAAGVEPPRLIEFVAHDARGRQLVAELRQHRGH